MGPLTEAELAQRLGASKQVKEYATPVDREPDLQLGVTLPGEATGWTPLNDVARDLLLACAVA